MNIEFDRIQNFMHLSLSPIYGDNDKCIKAKTKSYGDKGNTHFLGKKTPKENA